MHKNESVKYSICMCNYNMGDTIRRSLTTLIQQLDARYEILVVDDGSSDNSVEVLNELSKKHAILRFISLKRDPARKLGMTRNISIKEARGDFVILHLDCDDIFGPYIDDFVKVFHRLECAVGKQILLSGQHINMANRDFLLSHGPYLNVYRGEDRNLWSRMAKINCWIPLDHIDFITRLPKDRKKRFRKNIVDTFDHMQNDFRSGSRLWKYFSQEIGKKHSYSKKLFLFRLTLIIPAWFMSQFKNKIPVGDTLGSPELFAEYREKSRGTYPEIMKRIGKNPSLNFLDRNESKRVFSNTQASLDV